MSKEKFDLEIRAEKGEGLLVRGEYFNKGNTSESKFGNRKSNKFCRYCRKSGHVIFECFKLKNKRHKEEDNSHSHPHEPTKATFVESDFDGDVCLLSLLKGGVFLIGFLILGVHVICVLIRIGFQYMIQLTQLLFIWATMPKVMSRESALLKSRLMVLSGLYRMFVTFLT